MKCFSQFLWPWLLIGVSMSYSERGSKMAVDTVLQPKMIIFWQFQKSNSVFAVTTHVYWPANKNMTWKQHNMELKHKTAYLKLVYLPLSPLPLFSAHITTPTAKVWFRIIFLFTTNDVLFFYSTVRCSTVYHVIGASSYSAHACRTRVHLISVWYAIIV